MQGPFPARRRACPVEAHEAEGVPDADPPPVVLVVDVANTMGSRPDGWWRDRAGAAARLLGEIAPLRGAVVTTPDGVRLRVARLVAVVEGRARNVEAPEGVEAVRATTDGDDAVVAVATEVEARGQLVIVVTADRGLRARLPVRALVAGPRWLLS
jgi:hypothetical protein